ncbi:hypothetical protein GCM10009760_08810 [Kitasatospora kazusensis]|uniref:Cyclodipeptide synthase n=1 Tax=Kitasatospora kazusensis TaxID=407974 RepID=A0ABP5KIR9_9ACTN
MPVDTSLPAVTSRPPADAAAAVATPLTTGCARLAARRAHACIGISPFNGYFHAERIAALARWAVSAFDAVHFFIPDSLAAHTLEAVGYPPERAVWKARRQGQHLQNKVVAALSALAVPAPERLVLTSSALLGNPRYTELLEAAGTLFERDPGFRAACLQAADWVLERRLPPGGAATAAQRRTACRYLLGELPLFLDTPGIAGVAESVFCYHQTPVFLRRLFHRELACRPVPGQGYLQVESVGLAPLPRAAG